MDMLRWAENEIEIACKRERGDKSEGEWDYGVACYESALKAFKSLCEDEHSGCSIAFTKFILDRLIDGRPLTPVEDTEATWRLAFTDDNGGDHYSCNRMSSLYKVISDEGQVSYHDNSRCVCINVDDPGVSYHNGFVRSIYDEMFPLEMPYMPNSVPDKIMCAELLTDPKNGDFDTIAVLYVIRANGEKVDINRYFKEHNSSFVEISECEYIMREVMHKERLLNEQR